jgi:rhodanese-related sulfurtransferase
MGLFGKDIHEYLKEYKDTPHAVLIDVREKDEFAEGHIPGAFNVPLSSIQEITADKEAPLFVYCLRGSRSKSAVAALEKMGYTNVRSIGGIARYKGEIAR